MYVIPDDDYDSGIKHAMLHADLSQIYEMSKEKRNLIQPFEDRQKITRKYAFMLTAHSAARGTAVVHLFMYFEFNSHRTVQRTL